ncbi:MAG TPA: DNA polymerase/3'-5' exonuclease PolX [Vicinamibacteria bacterium]|nr:DNA polymerase/3'-5' exonuclease PolX [Vicinamibacteria bacterium]
MDNLALARCLHEIADILEIKGENSFRVRSYRLAAESVLSAAQDVAGMVRRGDHLEGLPGVGTAIGGKLDELVRTGRCGYHQELLREVPAGLLELLELPGLGPKGVKLVFEQLGVRSAEDLEAAIAAGRFRALKGMKEKKEARILKGLQERKRAAVRYLLPEAEAVVSALTRYLEDHGARQVVPVGSFRRRRETVGDLDLVVVGDPGSLSAAFAAYPGVREVLGRGTARSSVVLTSGLQVDLRPFPPESLGAALQYFTGSKDHNVALRERAVRRGLKLNEYGLYRVDTGERIAGATEEEVYAALGLACIPPELREDRGEIDAAARGRLPALLERSDVRGDLHSHTVESDGRDTLEAMVEAARARGLAYLAITEHSRAIPSRTRATGMDEGRCLAHIARVRALQEKTPGFRLFAGIEVDILPDGGLDMADEVLAQLDLVVGSLHSRLDMPAEQMTARVLRALENPRLHVWGHPLARLLRKREPVSLDVEKALEAAARAGVAVEINCQPDRLDLPDHLLRPARDRGVRFVVSTDSHGVNEFDTLAYGVAQARRGWLTAADVLNTREADAFRAALKRPAPA